MTNKEIVIKAINEVIGAGAGPMFEKSNHPAYRVAMRVAELMRPCDELIFDDNADNNGNPVIELIDLNKK